MNWSWTPIIYGVYPQVLYYGQLANVLMNPREAPKVKKATDLPVTIKLDDFRLDHESFLDEANNLHKWTYHNVQGYV